MKEQLGGREPRDFQVEIVQCQEERRDALCHAATGLGKTAVAAGPYALPENQGRVTIMVSPLIGLQDEMAQTFRQEYKVASVAVNSGQGGCTMKLMKEITNGLYQIVLISPEMLLSRRFLDNVIRDPGFASRVYSVVIDEAHCISHWGASFRKKYSAIGTIRVFLPRSVPFIALSASLTDRVSKDITHKLQFTRAGYLHKNIGNDRSNVSIVVRAIHNTMNSFTDLDFLIPNQVTDPGTIKKTWIYVDNIAVGGDIIDHIRTHLPEHLHGIIRPYNAVLGHEYRSEAMKEFRAGNIRILVCTDAAGMGCNVSDIDIVVQWKLPAKMSSFVQRAGRAARGPGRMGLAILLVEPTAYTVRLENEVNIELTKAAGSTRGKGKARQGAKKGRARGSRKEEKEYATQRGRYRGS
ncbi:P-loop containing nucleoside triphosphate hydrolase protein, partial [Leucogyrophana mollusca]